MMHRGRFAPSPTGALHLGNARTALLAWLDIRSLGGTFVLRMEDLDPQRSSREAARGILEDLRWLGLDWDEGPDVGGPFAPYTQSERSEVYRDAVQRLLADGLAFRCTCSRAEVARAAGAPHIGEEGPRYAGLCREGPRNPDRASSVRLRVEPGAISFEDLVHGRRSYDVAQETGDFVIQRADGVSAYQLAVALDDAMMQMTRVIRADDLLSSTPRQLLVMQALGFAPPEYGHVPLLMGEDGHRLAKRGGALTLQALRARGVAPETVLGFLANTLGLGDGRPLRARDLVPGFRLEALPRQPTVVDEADIARLAGAPKAG